MLNRVFRRRGSFLLQMFLVLSAAFGCVLLSGFADHADAAFSTADLQGTWYSYELQTGSAAGWVYATITVDGTGHATVTGVNTGGNAAAHSSPFTLQVDSNGGITIVEDPSAHGSMSGNKNIIALTYTNNSRYHLQVLVKGGGTFSASDIQGTWFADTLQTGGGAGWSSTTITIDSSGNSSTSNSYYAGNTFVYNFSSWLISSNGIVTNINSSAQGAMSSDKNFMVVVFTDGSSYLLQVYVKNAGGFFVPSDLEGSWSLHELASGTSPGLSYGAEDITAAGNVAASITDQNGNTSSSQDSLQVYGDGLIFSTNNASAVGAISADKSLMIWTYTSPDANGTTYVLGIDEKSSAPVAVFGDVPSGYWAFTYIDAIYNAGVTVGCGTSNGVLNYCPSNDVTRGQMAAFIIRALYGESFQYTSAPYFSDVDASNPFFKYVQKMKDQGITAGCGNGNYCPDDNVTREQMAAFLVRGTQVKNNEAPEGFTCNGGVNCSTTAAYFSDVPSTDLFFPYVQKLKELNITTVSSIYNPAQDVPRDQMAAFISRAFPGLQ